MHSFIYAKRLATILKRFEKGLISYGLWSAPYIEILKNFEKFVFLPVWYLSISPCFNPIYLLAGPCYITLFRTILGGEQKEKWIKHVIFMMAVLPVATIVVSFYFNVIIVLPNGRLIMKWK